MRTRLWISFGFLALAAVLMAWVTSSLLTGVSDALSELRKGSIQESILSDRMIVLVSDLQRAGVHEMWQGVEEDGKDGPRVGVGVSTDRDHEHDHGQWGGAGLHHGEGHDEGEMVYLEHSVESLERVLKEARGLAERAIGAAKRSGRHLLAAERRRTLEAIVKALSVVGIMEEFLQQYRELHDKDPVRAHVLWKEKMHPLLEDDLAVFVRGHAVRVHSMMERESAQMDVEVQRAAALSILGALLVGFGAGLLALYSAKIIITPLRRFEDYVKHVQDVGCDTTILKSGGEFQGEIRDVVNAFESLREKVHATTVSKSHVDAILESMLDGLLVLGADGRVEKMNPVAERLLGGRVEELVGRSLVTILDVEREDGINPLERVLKRLSMGGTLENVELSCRPVASEGGMVPILFSGTALRDPSGNARRLVCSFRDISDRKKAETELAELNRQLMMASREAGMAEVATGVLHNVGNILNSVNVSVTLIAEEVRNSRVSTLAKIVELLGRHRDDLGRFLEEDAKGRQVPSLLSALADQWVQERAGLLREVEVLRDNVDHIKQVVVMQQSYAKVGGVLEPVRLESVVEDALRLVGAGLAGERVQVVRCFEEVPDVVSDRHKVLQILVNLVNNARQAFGGQAEERRLVVGVRWHEDHKNVCVVVADNGVGIAPENLTRIFRHGFTTKTSGHGFGLHSGANAARELGGTLAVHSEGLGKGAQFTLILPARESGLGDRDVSQAA